MDTIDNKANYRSRELVTDYDEQRRIDKDDYVNNRELDYFTYQIRRLIGSTGSIIDMGAGTGKLSLAFARLGYSVTAFDQSEAMLERLEAKAKAQGLTIACRLGDIVNDAPRVAIEPSYDAAVSSRVLMHVADPEAMIKHMVMLSRKGVVLDAPRWSSPNRLLIALRAWTGGEVYRCFEDYVLMDSVARQGFKVIDATPMFNVPIGFHLALRNKPLSALIERSTAAIQNFSSTLFITAKRAS